jgi:hypothetical protein
MTSVGTVTLARSSRKSVRPNAVMQSSVPFGVVEPGGLADQVGLVARREEARGEPVEERDAVATHPVLELLDRRVVQPALGVVFALVEVGWHGGGKHGPRHARGAVSADVADDLAASHREADQRDVAKIQVFE